MASRLPWIILILLILVLLLPLVWLAVRPTGSYVNPMPRSNQANTSEVKTLGFYLGTTQASLAESKYHLLLSKDLNYITNTEYSQIIDIANEVGKMINGLISYLKSRI